jgi:antiviral helicase SKI2
VKLEGADEFLAEMLGEQGLGGKAKRRRMDGRTEEGLEVKKLGYEGEEKKSIGFGGSRKVDDLLPIGVSCPTTYDALEEVQKADR